MLVLLILFVLAYWLFALLQLLDIGKRELPFTEPFLKFLFSSVVPLFSAIVMIYLFILVGAETTMQFNVDNKYSMQAWSKWSEIWPVLVLLCAISSVGNLVWLTRSFTAKELKHWTQTACMGFLLSAYTLITVVFFYPSV